MTAGSNENVAAAARLWPPASLPCTTSRRRRNPKVIHRKKGIDRGVQLKIPQPETAETCAVTEGLKGENVVERSFAGHNIPPSCDTHSSGSFPPNCGQTRGPEST